MYKTTCLSPLMKINLMIMDYDRTIFFNKMQQLKFSKLIISFCGIIFLYSCASKAPAPPLHYYNYYSKWSREQKSYDGLTQSMQSLLVIMSPEMIRAQAQYKGNLYGWDQEKINQYINQNLSNIQNKTKVFLAFYFSQRRLSNLSKKNSPWRVFLDVENKRFGGQINREKSINKEELKKLYPDFTLWQIPYMIEFDVPWTFLEGKSFSIHISGPLEQQSFQF